MYDVRGWVEEPTISPADMRKILSPESQAPTLKLSVSAEMTLPEAKGAFKGGTACFAGLLNSVFGIDGSNVVVAIDRTGKVGRRNAEKQHLYIYNFFCKDLAIKMSKRFQHLLIATGNRGKLAEFRRLIAVDKIEVVGLDEFNVQEVEETGATFAENARLKAAGYAMQTGLVALADDSGLEVNELDGRPGVHSARYLGDVSFETRMESILHELAEKDADRSARFVCSIALATPAGDIFEQVEGVCEGKIAFAASGTNGFGYDPIFVPNGYELTFGELSNEIKNEISHRSAALSKIIPKIRGFRGF